MAKIQTSLMTKQTADLGGKLSTTELGGRLRVAHGSITPVSSAASGTVIEIVRLPKGARILPNSVMYVQAGNTSGATIKIGDSKDDDRYLAAATLTASAATINLAANCLGGYVLEDEDVISGTVGGSGLAASKTIAFDLYYVVD